MGFFDNELEPGHDAMKPCPACGEDKIYRTSDGMFARAEFFCDACGYEAKKKEVWKSFSERYDERYAELEEERGESKSFWEIMGESKSMWEMMGEPKPEFIKNSDLRRQVEDRQEEGWEIDEIDNHDEKVIMKHTKGGTIGGHALTGLTTGLWTFGLGNVAYNKISKKEE